MTELEFKTLINPLLSSIKDSYDLSKILKTCNLDELKTLTTKHNGVFIYAHQYIQYIMNPFNPKGDFFIIVGFDIKTGDIVIRFKKS